VGQSPFIRVRGFTAYIEVDGAEALLVRLIITFCLLLVSAGCVQVAIPSPKVQANVPPPLSATQAIRNFNEVVARVEPTAERVCRERTRDVNCDFQIRLETDPRAGVNAFQTVSRTGRPEITFTTGLIAEARNVDELGFIMGHEAAHHIAGHIPQQLNSAREGALVFGTLAQLGGADQAGIQRAVELGAAVGARRFSQDHELEADALGTVIAFRAGYDPLLGAAFFQRIPDPGQRFLGSHPPNSERQEVVRRTAAGLR
jgi:predicted Zn-dependent protease